MPVCAMTSMTLVYAVLVFGNQQVGDLLGHVRYIGGDKVGYLAVFGMAPAVIDDMQIRRIDGQKRYMA